MHGERKLNRLAGYDYRRSALYFVTSSVQDRISCFGEIKDHQIILNEYGQIAERQLQWLTQQYPYVILHSFVVMPNHIHVIIEIAAVATIGNNVGTGRDDVGTGRNLFLSKNENDHYANETDNVGTVGDNVGTGRDLSLQQRRQQNQQPVVKVKSLSELVGAYKTTTSKQIHLAGLTDFKWQ